MAMAASRGVQATTLPAQNVKVWSPVPLVAMVGIVLAICGAWRYYQQLEGLKSGLDASQAIFWEKWMPLFNLNMAVGMIVQVVVPVYLWLTRDQALTKLAPAVELKRFFVLFALLITLTMTQMLAITFGTVDAAWHQIVVRDTSLTPSHIVLFFGIVPLFTIFGLSAFFYSLTRIPMFADKLSLAMIIAVTAPFMVLPSVAYNEWGHAYWMMEELFIAPLHWGFVMLAWCFTASLGVIGQSLPRVLELVRAVNAPAVAR